MPPGAAATPGAAGGGRPDRRRRARRRVGGARRRRPGRASGARSAASGRRLTHDGRGRNQIVTVGPPFPACSAAARSTRRPCRWPPRRCRGYAISPRSAASEGRPGSAKRRPDRHAQGRRGSGRRRGRRVLPLDGPGAGRVAADGRRAAHPRSSPVELPVGRTSEIHLAPAHRLTLLAVDYPPDDWLAPHVEQSRSRRSD